MPLAKPPHPEKNINKRNKESRQDRQLLLGFHAVQTRVRVEASSIREVYVDQTRMDPRMRALLTHLETQGVPVYPVERSRLDQLAGRAGPHQGVAALVEPLALQLSLNDLLDRIKQTQSSPALLLALDGVTDPHNLGACLRVADAVGVQAVIAPKDHAVGLNETVMRAASGAADTVPYLMVTNLAQTLYTLQENDILLFGTADQAPQTLYDAAVSQQLQQPLAWVMGSEGKGLRRLSREACDLLVSIPMRGQIPSLNVSVATAVCLYETLRCRQHN